MRKQKIDGVMECVRYKPNGEVEWVRAYERRGATYSDHLLLKRETLIEKTQIRQKIYGGEPHFTDGEHLRCNLARSPVPKQEIREVLVTGDIQSNQDRLEGIPII